jgi:hypothetical protein
MLCAFSVWASAARAAAPQITDTKVSGVTSNSAILETEIDSQGKATRYHFEYGTTDCTKDPCTGIPNPDAELPGGSSPVAVKVPLEGLTPGTVYHFRVAAENGEVTKGPDRIFATRSSSTVGPPDGRAYEQTSPVDKDGGDAVGEGGLVKAAADGNGITFGSTFGIPGGVGAQGLPLYLGTRNATEWSTQGLFPPATLGERALVLGWLPDYSETFVNATKLGNPRGKALFALSTTGSPPTTISPYTANAEYFYAGADEDASTVVFESQAKLPEGEAKLPSPAATESSPNVYAWDRATGQLRLASVFNDGKSPPKGAFAGPYDFSRGTNAIALNKGGAERSYYLEEERAVTASGDVYFTSANRGQLYLRHNPTRPQSPLNGGKCSNPALACTIQVSASQKTNGNGPGGTDPAGTQPAAFQAASADGSKAFFTSSEMLTDDSNTGPEQPLPAIDVGPIGGGSQEQESFILTHAVGITVNSKYIYWADPAAGTIGRAELGDPQDAEQGFISTGSIKCEVEPKPGEKETVSVPSAPRYLAVDAGHVYWTNTGCLGEGEKPLDEGGTIGRATIEGGGVESEFIKGASNPQGIAINATHVFWVNRGQFSSTRTIARATLEGKEVEQGFFEPKLTRVPYGVALSTTHIYVTMMQGNAETEGAYVVRLPIEGGAQESFFVPGKLRSLAVDASNVYWVVQSNETIGRIPIADFPKSGPCEAVVTCDLEFTTAAGALNGLAANSEHLYWSVNGEAPTNPGTDLYRFEPNAEEPEGKGILTDLTVKEGGNGAEVVGVVGTSADGSRVYFVANAVLDGVGEATSGNCHGSIAHLTGSCNLYLWEEGSTTFVARLRGGALGINSDSLNWTGTTGELFGDGSYMPKTAFTSKDGASLLFRSQERLTAYDNEGTPELYRFQVGDPAGIRCVSCNPGGEAAGAGPSLGSIKFPGLEPVTSASVASRNLSSDGNRAFFETAEALVPADTNGAAGCPPSGSSIQSFPACLDTYEWEAPGTGTCNEGGPAYSPLNAGCVYLISTGKSEFPSLFADASASGNDVFFFTRQSLVGQDKDELQDVYDARVEGGLPLQNQLPLTPCESPEACRPGDESPQPAEGPGGSATFVGPGNPAAKHKKPKGKRHKKRAKAHRKRGAKR